MGLGLALVAEVLGLRDVRVICGGFWLVGYSGMCFGRLYLPVE